MIFCHSVIYGMVEDTSNFAYFFGDHLLGDWPAAIFLTISGFMLEYRQSGTGKLLKRGAFLIVVGMILAVINDGWSNFFECDVLTVIGVSSIVYPLLRGRSIGIIAGGIIAILLATAALQATLDYYAQWGGREAVVWYGNILLDPGEQYEVGAITAGTLGKAFLFNGFFPILPWLSFSMLGMLLAKREWSIGGLSLTGAGLLAAAIAGVGLMPLSFYPLSASFHALLIGLVLVVFAMRRWMDFSAWPLALLSRYSLTAYFAQYVFLDLIVRSFGQSVVPWQVYSLGLVVTLLVLALVAGIDRLGGKLSLEAALKKVAG